MEQEKLDCSICSDLLKDPVTIPCGHSYCMKCIRSYWDGEDKKHIYSCPQCRQMFIPRPDLKKSTILADLVEEVKKTRPKTDPADLCYAGPGDVSCDFCTGRKLKAVKSCLQCLVSYCDQHLQPHYQSPAFKKHKLVNPSKKLEENICSAHNEVMKIFCRTDQQCICYLCSLDEHKGHDTVSAAAERNDKQRELAESREKIQQRIREKEEGVKLLQQEIAELRRRSSELKLLLRTDDHIQFLHNYTLLGRLSEETDFLQDVLSEESTESSGISYQSPAFGKHKLVDPSKKLEENICSHHNEVMKIFCRTDQQCICYLCLLDEHRGHDTVSAAAEKDDKQRVVGLNEEKIQQRIREKEEGVKLLQQEITELRRRSSELKLLSQTDDHIQFLNNYTLLGRLSEETDSTVSDASDKPQDVLSEESTESSGISYQSPAFGKHKLVNPSKKLQEHPEKFTIGLFGKNPEFNKTIQHGILSNDITSDKTLNDFIVLENNSFRTISTHDFIDEECLYRDQKMIDFMAHSYDGLHLFILAIYSENAQEDKVVSQIIKLQDIFGENVTQHLVVMVETYKSCKSLSQLKEMFNIELGTLSEHLADDCKKWCSSRRVFKYDYRNYSEEVVRRRRNNLKKTRNECRHSYNYERPGRSIDSTYTPAGTAAVQYRGESKSSMSFNIVLLGLTGTGKSTSGNTILTAVNPQLESSQLFVSRPSSTPVTSKCEFRDINVFGRLVRVVDTPDFFDDEINCQAQVEECKKYCQPGRCVVLLVIQMGRFTDGERGILERLEKKLGWRIRENTIVLLTHGENAKGQEESFITGWTHLDSMVRACGNRFHTFENSSRKPKQVMELFKKIPDYETIFPEFTEKSLCCLS